MEFEIKDGEPDLSPRKRDRSETGAMARLTRAIDALGVGQWIEMHKKHRSVASHICAVFSVMSDKRYVSNASANTSMIIVRRTR